MKNQFFHTSFFRLLRVAVIFVITFFAAQTFNAQKLDSVDRGRVRDMLGAVKGELKDKYYDPTFHGIDIDARFKIAGEKLEAATSLGQAFGIIAQE